MQAARGEIDIEFMYMGIISPACAKKYIAQIKGVSGKGVPYKGVKLTRISGW